MVKPICTVPRIAGMSMAENMYYDSKIPAVGGAERNASRGLMGRLAHWQTSKHGTTPGRVPWGSPARQMSCSTMAQNPLRQHLAPLTATL